MNIPILIGIVATVTEIIKKGCSKYLKIEFKGKVAVILTGIVSLGVVIVEALKQDVPITVALLPVLIQVFMGSTIGYAIVTKKS